MSIIFTPSVCVGIVAGLLQFLGYFLYVRSVRKSGITPNASSWAIWAFGGLLNLFSYNQLVGGDLVKEILPFVCSLSAIFSFLLFWKEGYMCWPDKWNWLILTVDCLITVYWAITGSDEANLLYQVGTVISFFPIYRGIWNGTEKEESLPWIVWTIAYGLLCLTVFMRWEKWQDVVYPGVCLIVHFITAVLAHKTKNRS